MVEILGKRNKKVPVIITPDLKSALKVLADKEKEKSNIREDNPYVFPVNNGKFLNNLKGNDVAAPCV